MYFPVFHEDKMDGHGQISAVCARDVTFDGKQISVDMKPVFCAKILRPCKKQLTKTALVLC